MGQQLIESQFSGSQNLYWQWLKLLLNGFALIFIADLAMLCLLLMDVMQQHWVMSLFTLSESIYVFVLAAFAMRHPQLVFDRFDVSQKNRYQNSGLNQAMAEALARHLEDTVEGEKLYLDNELSLSALAQKLRVPEHHISQVLSVQLQQNFYEFINRKRIEHAKSLLSSNDTQYNNILAVAYGVGFNNKSSFNTAFKRFTQLTPSQFRQKNQFPEKKIL
ncbi:hypothetical protein MACH26_04260 [Planctobacterium marinum]|uniref:HTH araC/xylS-type domain-containing protein n=1 Tax=Planctobacterium marinum TaxID=1631968 RepID=A0AA48I2U5_9ALTE|nr:hypothetical protein MACH26_04260 [Planctobacterium marinum]